jgi:ribosomal protein S19
MDEPTIPELLRDLQADVSRILTEMGRYVTQEQHAADQKVAELRLEAVAKDVASQQARTEAMKTWVWTAVVAPVIVGVILYVVLGKS